MCKRSELEQFWLILLNDFAISAQPRSQIKAVCGEKFLRLLKKQFSQFSGLLSKHFRCYQHLVTLFAKETPTLCVTRATLNDEKKRLGVSLRFMTNFFAYSFDFRDMAKKQSNTALDFRTDERPSLSTALLMGFQVRCCHFHIIPSRLSILWFL